MPRPNELRNTIQGQLDEAKRKCDDQNAYAKRIWAELVAEQTRLKIVVETLSGLLKTTPDNATDAKTPTTTTPKVRKPRVSKKNAAQTPATIPTVQVPEAKDQTTMFVEDAPPEPVKHNFKCSSCGHEFDAPMVFTDGEHCPKCNAKFTQPTA